MATGVIVQEGDLSNLTANGALSKGMLVAYDTVADQVVPATAALAPIGVVDRDYADGATGVSVLALKKNRILHMIAAAAVSIGDMLETAAAGEAAPLGTDARDVANVASTLVGMARSAAAAQGDLVEVRIL